VKVLGVIDTINLKNLGMYGVGSGMFLARHRKQGQFRPGNKQLLLLIFY